MEILERSTRIYSAIGEISKTITNLVQTQQTKILLVLRLLLIT